MENTINLVKVVSGQLRISGRVTLPPNLLGVAAEIQRKLVREGRPVVVSGNKHSIVIESTPFSLIGD